MEFQAEKVGGKIHRILNETLYRKLTVAEYKRLTKLIGSVFKELPPQEG